MKTATFSIFAKMVVLFLATFITSTLLAPLMLKVEHADAMNWYVQCYFIHIAFHDISIEVYITRVHMHLYYFIVGGWLKSKFIQRVVILKFFYCCWYICIYLTNEKTLEEKNVVTVYENLLYNPFNFICFIWNERRSIILKKQACTSGYTSPCRCPKNEGFERCNYNTGKYIVIKSLYFFISSSKLKFKIVFLIWFV